MPPRGRPTLVDVVLRSLALSRWQAQDTELTPMGIIFSGWAGGLEREGETCGLVGGGGVPCPILPCKMRKAK